MAFFYIGNMYILLGYLDLVTGERFISSAVNKAVSQTPVFPEPELELNPHGVSLRWTCSRERQHPVVVVVAVGGGWGV